MTNKDYCKNIGSCLSFHQENIRFCTTLKLGPILSEYKESDKELIEKIVALRDKYNNDLKNDLIYQGCKDCIYADKTPVVSNKISRIDLFYWYHCNCGCVYCSYRDVTKGEFSDKVKPGKPVIYKIIKELYAQDKIDKESLLVIWGGGEITMLEEYPKMIDLFLKNNVGFISSESSGIKYSPTIEKILKQRKGSITVAVSAGSPETYYKIKRRDKYNQVIENLKKYAKFDKANARVISKYIILDKLNNNEEEIEKWLLTAKKINLKKVEISTEFCWGQTLKKGQKIEDYNYRLFDYVEKRCKELDLILYKNETSLAMMENGIY